MNDGSPVSAFVIAAMRLAGISGDEEALARVLPLAEAALADGALLTRAAAATLEPLSHPAGSPAPGRAARGTGS